jgi:FlaA1/EpsC-like NDP-sugar epimerase
MVIVSAAYLAPLIIRFEGDVPDLYWLNFRLLIPVCLTVYVLSNALFGLYGEMWKYASAEEARRVILSSITAGGFIVAGNAVIGGRASPLPLSVVVFGAALSLMGFGAVRFESRLFAFRKRADAVETKRALLVGAGSAGAMILKDLRANPSLGLRAVGIVDDDPRKIGLTLRDVRVMGDRSRIPQLVEKLNVDQVLLAIPSATSEVVRDVATLCERAHVNLRVLPSVREIVGGRTVARDFRDLQIDDLLGRQQVQTDLEAVAAMLRQRRVLVTGAGGSIGSEVVRQVASFQPASILLLDHDETHLHDVLTELDTTTPVETVLVDVRQQDRVYSVFTDYRPQVVFHAAAHKHVPLLEANPAEAVFTNVIGTANVADAAAATHVERFVLISTDKAVRPASVMGASKWFAEQIVRSLQGNSSVFCAVRFGNVLGSRGSVIPTFLRQIAHGGPVTVTDPAMTRYFMSIQEAVQLVLQAAALAKEGEVFTLDMGEPVNIDELARRVIRLSGHVPGKDIPVVFVGARPGEKLTEEVVDPDEEPMPSEHPGIVVARPAVPDRAALRRAIRELELLAKDGRPDELTTRIKALSGTPFESRVAEGVV